MSLINDALKKAKQAPKASLASAPQLQPVQAVTPSAGLSRIWLGLIVLGLFAGGFLVWIGTRPGEARAADGAGDVPRSGAAASLSSRTAPAGTPATPVLNSDAHPTVAAAAVPAPEAESPPPAIAPAITPELETFVPVAPTVEVAGSPTEAIVPVALPTPPLPPQWPKLQGIFYNPARPSALLDGRSVAVGGQVGGFRVVSIRPDRVTIATDSLTNVLSLSE